MLCMHDALKYQEHSSRDERFEIKIQMLSPIVSFQIYV